MTFYKFSVTAKSDKDEIIGKGGNSGGGTIYVIDPKKTGENSGDEKKFDFAFRDKNGKFIVNVLYEGDGTMAYILDKNLRKIRLKSEVCTNLIDSGRAVKVSPEEIERIIKSEEYKLQSAAIDENGKYIVMVLYENPEHFDEMTYILDKNLRKIRLKTRFCHELLESGRAVKVSPEEFNEIIKRKKIVAD